MTDEIVEAQENITLITKRKALNTPSKELDLGIEWI